jgi:hypothetical protein
MTTNAELAARIKALQQAYTLLLGWLGEHGYPEVIGELVNDGLRCVEHGLRLRNHDDLEVAALRELGDLIEEAAKPRRPVGRSY